jgi:hypothetical protein
LQARLAQLVGFGVAGVQLLSERAQALRDGPDFGGRHGRDDELPSFALLVCYRGGDRRSVRWGASGTLFDNGLGVQRGQPGGAQRRWS